MALVAKSVTASAPVTPHRGSSGSRSTVATFGAAVDGLAAIAGSHVEGANGGVVDQDGESRFGHRYTPTYQDHRDVPTPRTGVIDTPTQSFVSMLEFRDTFDAGKVIGEGSVKKFIGKLVGKAVQAYESHTISTSDDVPKRGETVSLTL